MLQYLKHEANKTYTENGAVTLASTGSNCLDLFAAIGALRHAGDGKITDQFLRAYYEDKDAAMKLLFYARDARGGLGERRVFRVILTWLAANHPESVSRNMCHIAEFGRYDDLLCLLDTPCQSDALALLRTQFERDMAALQAGQPVSLLGKWLPSVNATSATTVRLAKRLDRAFDLNDAAYRKACTALRQSIRIIENNLRERDYTFDYEKQPSRALLKYRKAFMRHDDVRYKEYLYAVQTGHATMHADMISPYELVEPYLRRQMTPQERDTVNATWASLPDYGSDENMLAVVDTSASMYWGSRPCPAAVALSLGLYLAEHSKGAFAGRFMEFSARPQLIELKGDTFVDRLQYAASFNEVANTNLEAVFALILDTAIKHNVPQSELPARLVIISDMEFDCCVTNASLSNFNNARKMYKRHGYTLPDIVFWNVQSRHRQQPVSMNDQGVMLVSGATPRIFKMVAAGCTTPMALMQQVLTSQRYACIAA